jgi:cytochrome d ubiquinol oxidase subunit I
MDPLLLSRLQFFAATAFHFLFVPLTLGLSIMVACMETQYVRSGDETYLRMTKFWGKLFLINFAVGIVTGITLQFQFGTNWSGYSAYVGDIFGSLLAIEASVAFFLESTLIGVWIFGWKKLSAKAHATVMWLVAGASSVSAIWILIANAWMQHPVGYAIRNGRAELVDFAAVVFNKVAILAFLHVISAAFILSAFFVMGISAYHLLKKQHVDFFTSYPNMFPSSINPEYSLTAHNASSSPLTLKIMLIVVLIFIPIVIAYQVWAYYLFKGKIRGEDLIY